MKNKALLFLLLIVLLSIMNYKACYWFESWRDHTNYPWAYSEHASMRLVGNWNGTFTDPDGIAHQLTLQIIDPVTEKERTRRVRSSSGKKRVRSRSYTGFEGFAFIGTNGRSDTMRINGSLKAVVPPTPIVARVSPLIDDNHQVGFEINQLNGDWRDGQLHLTAHFAYFRADKSSHYDSADPKHNFVYPLVLQPQP